MFEGNHGLRELEVCGGGRGRESHVLRDKPLSGRQGSDNQRLKRELSHHAGSLGRKAMEKGGGMGVEGG